MNEGGGVGKVMHVHIKKDDGCLLTTALSSDAQMRSDSADAEMGRANWNDAVAEDLTVPVAAAAAVVVLVSPPPRDFRSIDRSVGRLQSSAAGPTRFK